MNPGNGMLTRRHVLAAAAALPLVRVHAAERAATLRFVPNVDLPVLDPITNTAAQARTHAYMVWDTLFGLDLNYQPHHQMLAGHTVSDDALTWTLSLRPGLRFHDGEPVLARDVTASLRRWAAADGFGAALFAVTDEVLEPDDDTVVFRLKSPFPLLPSALGKMSPNVPVIMPARLAATPANQQVSEIVGSGPFRFVPGERVAGSRLVYERFDGYLARESGPAGFTTGPKRVFFDRVEWLVMPEAATAAAALQAGEVDWVETPSVDLMSMLRGDGGMMVGVNDTTGVLPVLRFNCLHPPFDRQAVRQAVLRAVSQPQFMSAYSDNTAYTHVPVGLFCPGSPMQNDSGMELVTHPDLAAAKAALAASGYGGERTVLLGATDHPVNGVMIQVAADLLKRLGMTVDFQTMDAGTMFQRRANRADVDHGGWSIFPSAIGGIDALDPAVSFLTRGNGLQAWYGWPTDPALETMRTEWLTAEGLPAQRSLAEQMQQEVLTQATFAPLGQILQPTAYRRTLADVQPGFAKFWGVRPA